MLNIILSNCPVKNGNRGCVALSISTMYLLKSILDEAGKEYTFYLPQSGHQINELGEHTISVGDTAITYTSITSPSKKLTRKVFNRLKNGVAYKKSLEVYKQADFMLDIGQGDSFSDIYGLNRFNTIYSSHEMSMKYKIPFCLLPQTVGPFENQACKEKVAKSLTKAKCVMVRDEQSYNYVKELIPNLSISEALDVAFYMPYEKKSFPKDKIHVGINISALLWNGGYTQDNQFDLKVNYQELINDIIKHFLSDENTIVHLISHVVGSESGIENDYEVAYKIAEEYNNDRLVLAPLFLDPIKAKNYIAGMDFFMGARMHSAIAAFSSGVAGCPMAYSRKFNGLFEDTLNYNHVVDMKAVDNTAALEIIKQSYIERKKLQEEIETQNKNIVVERYEILKNKLIDFLEI